MHVPLLTVDVAQPAEPVRHQLQRHKQIGVGNHPRNDQNANLCLGVPRHISGHRRSPSAHPMPQGGAAAVTVEEVAASNSKIKAPPPPSVTGGLLVPDKGMAARKQEARSRSRRASVPPYRH